MPTQKSTEFSHIVSWITFIETISTFTHHTWGADARFFFTKEECPRRKLWQLPFLFLPVPIVVPGQRGAAPVRLGRRQAEERTPLSFWICSIQHVFTSHFWKYSMAFGEKIMKTGRDRINEQWGKWKQRGMCQEQLLTYHGRGKIPFCGWLGGTDDTQ